MALTPEQQEAVLAQLGTLTPQQLAHVLAVLERFGQPIAAKLIDGRSTFITPCVVTEMGVRLMAHHARSTQAMTKTIFEHAFTDSLNACKIPASMHRSGTNRGYDLTVNSNIRVSLKSESSNVNPNELHISKWMELGKDPWEPTFQHGQFLGHLQNYDVILTLRCLSNGNSISYELVEIPKSIFTNALPTFTLRPGRTPGQISVPPASASVHAPNGGLIYELYHDGGSERKLQIRHLAKSACIVRATWQF